LFWGKRKKRRKKRRERGKRVMNLRANELAIRNILITTRKHGH
jgi:hypothetical protein